MSQFIVHCSCYESSSMCNVQLQDRSNWHTVTQLRRFSSVTHNHSIFCPHELHSYQIRRVDLSSDLLHLQIYRDAPARAWKAVSVSCCSDPRQCSVQTHKIAVSECQHCSIGNIFCWIETDGCYLEEMGNCCDKTKQFHPDQVYSKLVTKSKRL